MNCVPVRTSAGGLQSGWIRATSTVRGDHPEKSKGLAYWDLKQMDESSGVDIPEIIRIV